jgi:hypothetical protein
MATAILRRADLAVQTRTQKDATRVAAAQFINDAPIVETHRNGFGRDALSDARTGRSTGTIAFGAARRPRQSSYGQTCVRRKECGQIASKNGKRTANEDSSLRPQLPQLVDI